VRLADVVTPSVNDPDSLLRNQARRIQSWARENLLNWPVILVPSPTCVSDSIQAVHLYKKYPLVDTYINALWLEKGWGLYAPCDTMGQKALRAAADRGREEKRGYWAPRDKSGYQPLNRLRITLWLSKDALLIQEKYPLLGLSYRMSDFVTLYKSPNKRFQTSLSLQTGTYLYFFLPYLNVGPEVRYENYYARGFYGVSVIYAPELILPVGYYGLDVGFRTDVR